MIPVGLVAQLRNPPLAAADFTPTKFSPADNKAWFAQHFMRFASSDFPRHQFTERFYNRLMNTFGHIAHYGRDGFWTEFFDTTAGKVEFLEQTINWRPYCDPTHTWCDVERVIIQRLKAADLHELYRARLSGEEHARERAELARLRAKYETIPAIPVEPSSPRPANRAPARPDQVQLTFALG